MSNEEQILDIDLQVLDYIDGAGSEEQRTHVAQMIATNALWKARWEELRAFDAALHSSLEVEQPSMRFTQNVMDAVGKEKILKPAKSYINQWIIWGIGAFFMIIIGAYLIDLIQSIKWSSSDGSATAWLPKLSFDSKTVLYGMLFGSSVTGLIVLDMLIRRRKLQDSNP